MSTDEDRIAAIVSDVEEITTLDSTNLIETIHAIESAGYKVLPIEVADRKTGEITAEAIGLIRQALSIGPEATVSIAYAHSSESYVRGYNQGSRDVIGAATVNPFAFDRCEENIGDANIWFRITSDQLSRLISEVDGNLNLFAREALLQALDELDESETDGL